MGASAWRIGVGAHDGRPLPAASDRSPTSGPVLDIPLNVTNLYSLVRCVTEPVA